MARLVSLAGLGAAIPGGAGGGPGKDDAAPARPVTRGGGITVAGIGYKAERLARAMRAGLPVLPGWAVPVAEGRRAMAAGADAVRARGLAAGRVAVLAQALDPALGAELRDVVDALGGRVIVRSSSPLEGDAVWAGAFSSVAGVQREDVATAVRSCWASAFAVDPLRRLEGCGLGLEALELGVLVQPEIVPDAGGVARVRGGHILVEGVRGHPGALLSGWAEGAWARVPPLDAGPGPVEDGGLGELAGPATVAEVAGLAGRVYAELGDDVIEWAARGGKVWLLQAMRGAPEREAADPVAATADGALVLGRAAAPGTGAGPLVACRARETAARDCRGAVLLVDRPVPGLAPLLFGARGVISRAGAAGSHLAEVARSLGVPMVTGCRPEAVTGPGPAPGAWFATINGTTGEVALRPAGTGGA